MPTSLSTAPVRLLRNSSRQVVFHDATDYREFSHLLDEGCRRAPVKLLGWCLLPNAIYILTTAPEEAVFSRWSQWVLATHAKRHHARHATNGSLWRDRALRVRPESLRFPA